MKNYALTIPNSKITSSPKSKYLKKKKTNSSTTTTSMWIKTCKNKLTRKVRQRSTSMKRYHYSNPKRK